MGLSAVCKCFICVCRTEKFWTGLRTDLVIEETIRSLKSLGELARGSCDVGKNTKDLWIATLPSRAEVDEKIRSVTNTSFQSSELHKELSRSRCQRGYKDL